MAERRMFAKTIIDSDAFLDMPVTARLLYYDLAMRADDDGFINSPKKIMRMVGASPDDLSVLILRKFIIPFENGVVVIKHWRIHNYIRKDTYTETTYKEQKALLDYDENKAYTLREQPVDGALTSRGRTVDEPLTQVSIGKVSIGKDSINNKAGQDAIIDEFTQNEELKEAIREFAKMRKLIKKPLTDKALSLLLFKLTKLAEDDETQIAILNQSISNSWQGVFPLKQDQTYNPNWYGKPKKKSKYSDIPDSML